MTVQNTDVTTGPYIGNNQSDQYDFDFVISDASELVVFETASTTGSQPQQLTIGTDYTVSINSNGTGTITRVAGNLPTNYVLFMRAEYQAVQPTAFDSQGGYFPFIHERAFDRVTRLIQQLNERVGKAFKLADSYGGGASAELPEPEAFHTVRWNADADALENVRIDEGAIVNEINFTLNPPVGADILGGDVQDAINQTAINTDAIAQEAVDRVNAVAQEAVDRAASIAAAVVDSETADATIQAQLDTVETTANNAASGISGAVSRLDVAESRLNDVTGGTGTAISIEELAANVETLENSSPSGGGATIQSVQDVNARVDTLQGEVDTNAADITTLTATANNAETTANAANTVASTAQSEVDALESTVTGLSTDVSTLQTDVSTATGIANAANTAASNAQTTADTAQGDVDALSTTVTSLQSDVTNAENNASSAVTTANAAQSTANAANNTANSTAASLTTVQSDVDGLSSTVTTQATTLSSVQDGITNQQVAYAIVANAGDSDAAIEVTANGGVGSQINLKADRTTIDRGNGTEQIATLVGESFFSNTYNAQNDTTGRMINDSGNSFYYYEISDFELQLLPGRYNIKGLLSGVTYNSHLAYFRTSTVSSVNILGGLTGFQRINNANLDNSFSTVPASSPTNMRVYNEFFTGTGTDSSAIGAYRMFFDFYIDVTQTTNVTPYIYGLDVGNFGNQGLTGFCYLSAKKV